ncbi:hypothetical protein [Niastella sp. OAS944]|uniref:hypothetical protein n=1 Tax=Niastella sp. OAS944 TaxID=2664089 RepID=UPI00347C2B57|nr:hypothetical protein [Chitinophagaceae bacterium OAS944]
MRKTKSNIWLQIAFCSLIFASCQKSVDTTSANGNGQAQSNTLSSARVAIADCLATADTVNGTGNGYTYTNWTPTTKVLAGGPTLQFEGHYASFIRPATASWYVGTISKDSTCADWDELIDVISVKNAPGNVTTTPANPYNVIGYRSSTYGLGYYVYASTVPSVDRSVVIWKDANSTSDSYVSDPVNATEAYVLQVQSIVPGGVFPALTSQVIYKYHRVL